MALKNVITSNGNNVIFAADKNAVFEKGSSTGKGRVAGLRVVGIGSRFNARRTGVHK